MEPAPSKPTAQSTTYMQPAILLGFSSEATWSLMCSTSRAPFNRLVACVLVGCTFVACVGCMRWLQLQNTAGVYMCYTLWLVCILSPYALIQAIAVLNGNAQRIKFVSRRRRLLGFDEYVRALAAQETQDLVVNDLHAGQFTELLEPGHPPMVFR